MHVYSIGLPEGHRRIGYAREAHSVLSEMQEHSPPGLTLQWWDMDTGRAMLLVRMFYLRAYRHSSAPGWFDMPTTAVADLVRELRRQIEPEALAGIGVPSRAAMAGMMLHLRTNVFCTTQEMMGEIAGRTAPIISRWEAGTSTPGLEELSRIRAAAMSFGLPWDDAEVLDATGFSASKTEDSDGK